MKLAGKTIAFRADASLQMGTGHVMRCLTLADALSVSGAVCHFICREHPGHLSAFITQRGFQVHILDDIGTVARQDEYPQDAPLPHAAWLGTTITSDAAQTAELLKHISPDWLIVDHYALDYRWERQQRMHATKIMAIDDLADRQHDCDLLLDQNLGRKATDYTGLVPDSCRKLLGPQYALLRPEFAKLRTYSLQRRKTPRLQSLLITMGGVDKDNATGQILWALKTSPLPTDCKITVVMGATAPWLAEVRDMASQLPWNIEVRVNVSDMAALMAESDLAIGAAGSTSWERCCLGLPTFMVVLAENQREAAGHIEKSGAATLLSLDKQLSENLDRFLAGCLLESDILLQMSASSSLVTDGVGVTRVADFLQQIL